MAGPAKNRGLAQKAQQQQAARSSNNSSSSRDQPTQRSINKFDGNKDPQGHGADSRPEDRWRSQDLKNLSEFLGIGGWAAARGVSTNAPISTCICIHARNCLPCIHTMRSRSPRTRRSKVRMHSINTPPPPVLLTPSHSHIVHSFRNKLPSNLTQFPHCPYASTCTFDYLSPSSCLPTPTRRCSRTSTPTALVMRT